MHWKQELSEVSCPQCRKKQNVKNHVVVSLQKHPREMLALQTWAGRVLLVLLMVESLGKQARGGGPPPLSWFCH